VTNNLPALHAQDLADTSETKARLIAGGMSQRQAAKVLGVSEGTIRNDVRNDYAKSAQELRTGSEAKTGSAETKARRAASRRKADEGDDDGGEVALS
jgi:transposase